MSTMSGTSKSEQSNMSGNVSKAGTSSSFDSLGNSTTGRSGTQEFSSKSTYESKMSGLGSTYSGSNLSERTGGESVSENAKDSVRSGTAGGKTGGNSNMSSNSETLKNSGIGSDTTNFSGGLDSLKKDDFNAGRRDDQKSAMKDEFLGKREENINRRDKDDSDTKFTSEHFKTESTKTKDESMIRDDTKLRDE